jgi:Ni,Fe-hydrogenase I cytochrome b subunit
MELVDKEMVVSVGAASGKKYSASIRLWHWLNAIVITGSLLTVLVNSTVLKPWSNADMIVGKLQENGINISQDQARPVAFALADKVWDIHVYFGYTLAALFLFRIILEFFELADKKLIRKIRTARAAYLSVRGDRFASRNEMLIKTVYAVFYILLAVMVITGLSLAFRDKIPALKSLHFIRDIHEFTMYLILGFIIIHLAGVFLGERKGHKGVVSDMINGGEVKS